MGELVEIPFQKMTIDLNDEVTHFLEELDHPLSREIDRLRRLILSAGPGLTENIKWNGPNYRFRGDDRITMKIQPPKQLQLIFHRGAKKVEPPKERLIEDPMGLLSWRANDRAVATFRNMDDIENSTPVLMSIIKDWIEATS